jgi:hypothetical protein
MKRVARSKTIDADRAKRIAIEYCLLHYPTLFTGGIPRRPKPADSDWRVPVLLEDPDAGLSVEVGELTIDSQTGRVSSGPPLAAIVAAGQQHYKESAHAPAPAVSARNHG